VKRAVRIWTAVMAIGTGVDFRDFVALRIFQSVRNRDSMFLGLVVLTRLSRFICHFVRLPTEEFMQYRGLSVTHRNTVP
jgi:hypothetical protein